MKISIIIPVLNEEAALPKLLEFIIPMTNSMTEIIVVDGGSTDRTLEKLAKFPVQVINSKAGRAVQMNTGAAAAVGEILYFLHSDTTPPTSFLEDISTTIQEGFDSGCYRLGFDSDNFLLKINTYCTRFRFMWCRGGDQSLFVKKSLFEKLGGFPKGFIIMEEYPLIKKLMKQHNFRIVPKVIIASSRKYEKNNYLKVQLANLIIFNMSRMGYSQEKMYKAYRTMLKF